MPVQNKPHHPQFSLIVLGLATSYFAVRLIANQIWGILQYDLLALAVVVLTMFLVGLTACYFPARKATQIDPLVALGLP